MRLKLLALASVVMVAIGTGGVIATDPASTDDVQVQNDTVPSNVDDGVGDADTDEEPDRKFGADELERMNLSNEDIQMQFVEADEESGEGDSVGDVSKSTSDSHADEEPDRKFGADELERTNLSNEDIEMQFIEADQRLTAEELELRPQGIASNDDGTTVMTFEEPSEVSVASNTTSAGV